MSSVVYIYTKYFIVPTHTESRLHLHKIMDSALSIFTPESLLSLRLKSFSSLSLKGFYLIARGNTPGMRI
jgi:hypothetical protein